MQKIRAPEQYLKAPDHQLIKGLGLLALLIMVPVPNLLIRGAAPLNDFWLGIIPLPVAILSLLLPLGVYFGILFNQQGKYHDFIRETHRIERTKLAGRLSFKAYLQAHVDGTSWEIHNTNRFAWHETKVLIERFDGRSTVCEKHSVGEVDKQQSIRLESHLQDGDLARWRIMVVTREGSLTEFPDRWHAEQAKAGKGPFQNIENRNNNRFAEPSGSTEDAVQTTKMVV